MKIRELVSKSIAANDRALGDITEARDVKMVTFALREIAREINGMDEGRVVIPGLGIFVVKIVDKEKDGAKLQQKRIVFHLPKLND